MNIKTMCFIFIFALAMLGFAPPAAGQEDKSAYAGDWVGSLDTGSRELAIVFHLMEKDDQLIVTMDSPDQGAFDIPATAAVTSDGLRVDIAAATVVFTGVLVDADTITGTFSQRGNNLPLVLTRQEGPIVRESRNRPQTPQAPFDYITEEVQFVGGEDGVVLAGTLSKPKGAGPFPAIIMITGSGPQDRDETLADHKPFFVIADHLTKAGFAVLRYDDRGTASSTGDFASATSADFADDAAGAVDFLAIRDDINTAKISLLGHSEGGLVAPIVASRSARVSALILLAPPVLPMAENGRIQIRLQAESNGVSEAQIQERLARTDQLTDVIQSTASFEEARVLAREVIAKTITGEAQRERQLRRVDRRISPWSHFVINHDPTTVLRQINKVAVLAIFAEKDVSVSPSHNSDAFKQVRSETGAKNWQTHTFSGLNHLFQLADTGSQREYSEIEETINPVVLNYITAWISGVSLDG